MRFTIECLDDVSAWRHFVSRDDFTGKNVPVCMCPLEFPLFCDVALERCVCFAIEFFRVDFVEGRGAFSEIIGLLLPRCIYVPLALLEGVHLLGREFFLHGF